MIGRSFYAIFTPVAVAALFMLGACDGGERPSSEWPEAGETA